MNSRDIVIVQSILDVIVEVNIYILDCGSKSSKDFESNPMLKRATTMSLINICEMVGTLSDAFKATHSQIIFSALAHNLIFGGKCAG